MRKCCKWGSGNDFQKKKIFQSQFQVDDLSSDLGTLEIKDF